MMNISKNKRMSLQRMQHNPYQEKRNASL